MKKILIIAVPVIILLSLGVFLISRDTESDAVPAMATSTPVAVEDNRDNMETWNWVYSEMSAQGTQFMYPDPLPISYVTPVEWPPQVVVTGGKLECAPGMVADASGTPKLFAQRTIGGQDYCVGFGAEGAAGSTFTSYEYAAQQGDFIVRMSFTLQTPQCLNYDDPERSVCRGEQARFSTDALVVKMISSLKTR